MRSRRRFAKWAISSVDPDRGSDEVARLDDAIARARNVVSQHHFEVLPLSRRGWVSGTDSPLSSLLAETGLFNAAGDLGIAFGGYASLETIVKLKPDFIVVSDASDRAEDDGHAFPAASCAGRELYPLSRRIVIPDRLTVCGGVMIADALDRLVSEWKRVEQ